MKQVKQTTKECANCGKIHCQIPVNARAQLNFNEDAIDGWVWECGCTSTMFAPIAKYEMEKEAS